MRFAATASLRLARMDEMRRLLLLLAIAACGHTHPSLPDSRPALDGPGEVDAPSSADAAIDAPAGFVLPPTDLGTLTVGGTCTDVYHGWSFNDTTGCSPDDRSSTGPSSRQITIASDPMGGYQMTTMLRYDPVEHVYYDPYTVTLSQAQPTAREVGNPSCDPIYGTCLEHDWTLAAHSLVLATHSLHDNSSPSPLPQCWEYYSEKIDCTFELDW